MSWLNIGGNLSNLANNVTSFTKEVLTEANRQDGSIAGGVGEGDDDDLDATTGDFNPVLRDELLFLRSESNTKDEHIANLQEQIEKLKFDFQKHSSNLQQHLLLKDEEIDAYAEKIHQSETVLNEKISELTNQKSRLENKLADKMSDHDTDNDSDWGNDWGGGGGDNELELSNLKDENESLSNEVSMKEIVLSSVETKLRQLSGGKHIDASDFADWIDAHLDELKQESEKASNLTELALCLKEEMGDNSEGDSIDLDAVYDWLNSQKEEKLVLERKITKLENTILSIEENVRSYEKGLENFKIADFSDWVKKLSSSKKAQPVEKLASTPFTQSTANVEDDGSKALIMSIQASVRDFDEGDEDFEIKDFQTWIEKVQNRLDDLEVELLNEQELQESEEKQRIEERAKLKELFDEKENQISQLKVELYHRSNENRQESPVIESPVNDDQSSHLQEQYTEAIARCEGLQNELTASKKKSLETINNQTHELEELTKTNSEMYLRLENTINEKEGVDQKFMETEQTVEELRNRLEMVTKNNEDLEQAVESAQKTLENDSNEKDRVTRNLADTEKTVETLKKEIEQLNNGTNTTIENMAKKNEILKNTIENIQREHSDTGDLAVQLQHASMQIENLNTQCTDVTEKHRGLETELSYVCEDLAGLQGAFQVMVGEGLDAFQHREWPLSKSEKTKPLTQTLKDAYEQFLNVHQENTRVKDEMIHMELQLENHTQTISSRHDLLQCIISDLSNNVFPGQTVPPGLTSAPPSADKTLYLEYTESCASHVIKLKTELTALQKQKEERDRHKIKQAKESDELEQQIVELQQQVQSLEIENASLTTTEHDAHQQHLGRDHEPQIRDLEEELVKANADVKNKTFELEALQNDTEAQMATVTALGNSLKEAEADLQRQKQQQQTESHGSEATGGGGGMKFGGLKRKLKDLENDNANLKHEIEQLKNQQSQFIQQESGPEVSQAQSETNGLLDVDAAALREEIEELKQELEDVQLYNTAYQREVEQLKQQLNEKEAALQQEKQNVSEDHGSEATGSEAGGQGMKFGVLKRKLKELEEENVTLQQQVKQLKHQQPPPQVVQRKEESMEVSGVQTTNGSPDNALREEIKELRQELEDVQTYNAAYEREVTQLKQQLNDTTNTSQNQEELQNNVQTLTQQLQQYQTYSTNLQAENEHLKRLSQAAMVQGSEQEVAIRAELQNQIASLTNENQHYQTEYENLRQGWIKYQQESNTYMESIQQQYHQLQTEHEKLQQQKHGEQTQQSTAPDSSFDSIPTGGSSSNQLQEKMHNLSLMLTEKAEQCVRLQQENDVLQAKLVEIQNETSDMELIREECKQLKTMLMSKDHEETISNLQTENKHLKKELDQIHKLGVEKDNDLSDMELLREECKQLKLMLVNKDTPVEFQHLHEKNAQLEVSLRERDETLLEKNASMIEMENRVSDLDLVREECKQLKVMLMNKQGVQQQSPDLDESYRHLESQLNAKNEEILQKDSIILEMQNTSADVELLREQCEQLKTMLSEKEGDSVLQNSAMVNENSFMVQVQQLEDVMKEKDDVINQKNAEITELRNSTSDMELLHNECRALKEMIADKERMFMELQNDLDLVNDMMEQKNSDVSVKVTENKLLREQMQELNQMLVSKEQEISNMREEMQEAVLQDENIHLLQTEYRNVEEQLKSKEQELQETQQNMFDLETRFERVRTYEDQYQVLKNTLQAKEEELGVLQLQSNESSILESDTVSLLHQESNRLKSIVYEREQQADELNKVLEKKNFELQDYQGKLNHAEEALLSEKNKVLELQNKIQALDAETSSRDHQKTGDVGSPSHFTEADSQLVYYKSMVDELTNENEEVCEQLRNDKKKIKELTDELRTMKKNKNNVSLEQKQFTTMDGDNLQNQTLHAQQLEETIRQHEQYSSSIENERQQLNDNLQSQILLVQQLQETVRQHEQYNMNIENERQHLNGSLQNQVLMIQELEETIRQNEQNRAELLETVSAKGNESVNLISELQNENQVFKVSMSNLKTILQLPEMAMTNDNLSNEMSEIVQKVQTHLSMIQQRDTMIQRLKTDYETQCGNLQNDLTAKEIELNESKHEHEFKLTDLQSQVTEYRELEAMYQGKCAENDNLQSGLNNAVNMLQQQQQAADSTQESDRLREELAKMSHSLSEKTEECEQLKLEILKLEEKMFNQQHALSQVGDTEQLRNQLQEFAQMCQYKDQQLYDMQSKLQDSFAALESGKKEKAFLDQLVHEKQVIATEKEELAFQRNELSKRVQELEVGIRHKETQLKEIEVKTKRELERLRNHLIMMEENHTKDIVECQEREDALRNELNSTTDTLGKKSMILQDSSKQFQDHVGTLEEQLHVIAAQRDANTLNLEKCREKMEGDSAAIYNLQHALEQLQREKDEQYEYMISMEKKKENGYEKRIDELVEEQENAKSAMNEASLAVQGITKLQFELEQKERELKLSNDQVVELVSTLKEREMQYTKILQASDGKMDKSLIRNLLLKYFQSPEDKRAEILKIVGGLLDLSHDQVIEIGSGAPPSKVGGWISNVWGYAATPKKSAHPPPTPTTVQAKVDPNQSFSEMFIKFLEHESTHRNMVDSSASLANAANTPMQPASNVLMLSHNPPDILHFNKKPDDLNSSSTIPAPGQEIPRVHTHHAQSTLKNLLS